MYNEPEIESYSLQHVMNDTQFRLFRSYIIKNLYYPYYYEEENYNGKDYMINVLRVKQNHARKLQKLQDDLMEFESTEETLPRKYLYSINTDTFTIDEPRKGQCFIWLYGKRIGYVNEKTNIYYLDAPKEYKELLRLPSAQTDKHYLYKVGTSLKLFTSSVNKIRADYNTNKSRKENDGNKNLLGIIY